MVKLTLIFDLLKIKDLLIFCFGKVKVFLVVKVFLGIYCRKQNL